MDRCGPRSARRGPTSARARAHERPGAGRGASGATAVEAGEVVAGYPGAGERTGPGPDGEGPPLGALMTTPTTAAPIAADQVAAPSPAAPGLLPTSAARPRRRGGLLGLVAGLLLAATACVVPAPPPP